eukprot:Ihof_evm3s3 gene=Ihof_evmTU3s3
MGKGQKSKSKGTTMALSDFMAATEGASWADETDSLPTGPSTKYVEDAPRSSSGLGGAFARLGYGEQREQSSGSRYDAYPSRDRESSYSRPERERTSPSAIPTSGPFKAYVGNLSWDVDETALSQFFTDNGCKVVNAILVMDRESGRPKGFGYVEFADRDSLVKALEGDGQDLMERKIRVDVSETKERSGGFGGAHREESGEPGRSEGNWRSKSVALPPVEAHNDRYGSRSGYGDRDRSYGDRDTGRSGGFSNYGGDRDRSSYNRDSEGGSRWGGSSSYRDAAPAAAPMERRKLNLKPRTTPVEVAEAKTPADGQQAEKEAAAQKAPAPAHPKSNPFGAARPVDTAAKEAAIEKKLAELRLKSQAAREAKEAASGEVHTTERSGEHDHRERRSDRDEYSHFGNRDNRERREGNRSYEPRHRDEKPSAPRTEPSQSAPRPDLAPKAPEP